MTSAKKKEEDQLIKREGKAVDVRKHCKGCNGKAKWGGKKPQERRKVKKKLLQFDQGVEKNPSSA